MNETEYELTGALLLLRSLAGALIKKGVITKPDLLAELGLQGAPDLLRTDVEELILMISES